MEHATCKQKNMCVWRGREAELKVGPVVLAHACNAQNEQTNWYYKGDDGVQHERWFVVWCVVCGMWCSVVRYDRERLLLSRTLSSQPLSVGN
jgi:hypothetical protein